MAGRSDRWSLSRSKANAATAVAAHMEKSGLDSLLSRPPARAHWTDKSPGRPGIVQYFTSRLTVRLSEKKDAAKLNDGGGDGMLMTTTDGALK